MLDTMLYIGLAGSCGRLTFDAFSRPGFFKSLCSSDLTEKERNVKRIALLAIEGFTTGLVFATVGACVALGVVVLVEAPILPLFLVPLILATGSNKKQSFCKYHQCYP